MNHATVKNDYFWMAKAIQLAQKGRFTTSPNPRVGCVIVDENNQLLGQGYHVQAGTPHAEVHALRQASNARSNGAKGATAYVTLEPCSHFGRTPPCANALIEAQVARVVVAMTDPNPNVCGNGINMLQAAGIEVVSDVMAAEAAALNPGFTKRMLTGKPFVRVKLGISLDGKIALQNGVSQWITGPEARRDVQRYRAQSCAVLTGSGTVAADNPSLLVREQEAKFENYPLEHIRQPARIVVDSQSKLNRDFNVFSDGHVTFTATLQAHPDTSVGHYIQVDEKDGKVDLHGLMSALGDKQYNEVWVEAGPGLAGALLQEGLVDELICYQAPKLLGDKGVSMVNLPAFTALNQSISLSLIENRQVGNDIKLIFRPDVSNTCR
ncbi:bifunctional diaminohydroxyphosphoribosylaminopyrimidine deaminase/5-amino-6-(5-phosphoribosylamino)uracil reductase RibD [Alteromonas gracilis]|uniref:Riboflavin biosynthesis protein RibD n=1 Tax=Alteromonas gracilis TaxID=1479524 RepID=A0ABX5CQH2_9ALTE|nr:bifunctional diaminohydroxyphosphoribosylaminopyrimidine deaminase/5-amino-6-(5-phosphoribosylamino)uracil reductase RibD [Alteromonas gracilis]PRO68581.1 bifunctional diaminohydroxyphosphoribosylaminopyrimidine deaminase/5-amino-6-(5-phosphoribosylamino)uracil reductase RibD [Alteromonas gracilis]